MSACEKKCLRVPYELYPQFCRGETMRTDRAFLLGMVLLSVAFVSGCVGNAEAWGDSEEDQALLELKGDSGTELSGSCAVGDEEPEEISGQVPQSFTYDLAGNPLKCEITSEGNIEANVTAGNTRSVQRFSGGTLNLTYENGSISSFVSSSSGSSGQASSSSSQIISSSSAGNIDEEPSNVTSESRNVSGFEEVELQGVGNLSIQQTDSESLTVEAEEDVLSKIRTEVENDRLIIGPEPNTSIQTTQPINYDLTVKDLNALKVSGSGNVDAEDISTDELAVTTSGTGNVKISGEADSQGINISGSGSYQAEDLESKEVKVDVGGSGSAIVNVSDELDAKVSGIGSVEYIGDPTVNQYVSGAGRVSKH
jgi:Putative auto-transporter adhesin, head GIN domain